jgi:hypothetical protein
MENKTKKKLKSFENTITNPDCHWQIKGANRKKFLIPQFNFQLSSNWSNINTVHKNNLFYTYMATVQIRTVQSGCHHELDNKMQQVKV